MEIEAHLAALVRRVSLLLDPVTRVEAEEAEERVRPQEAAGIDLGPLPATYEGDLIAFAQANAQDLERMMDEEREKREAARSQHGG